MGGDSGFSCSQSSFGKVWGFETPLVVLAMTSVVAETIVGEGGSSNELGISGFKEQGHKEIFLWGKL